MDMCNCDKCGERVASDNDAVMLDIIISLRQGEPGAALVLALGARARHLIPTDTCPGSPSRYQYLPGYPRDTRGCTYDPEYEPEVRAAYAEMIATRS